MGADSDRCAAACGDVMWCTSKLLRVVAANTQRVGPLMAITDNRHSARRLFFSFFGWAIVNGGL